MAKALKFGNAILCEFISRGAGNKHSLINVFSGDVIVSEFPATMMIAVYIEYTPDPTDPQEVSLHVYIGDDLAANVPVKIKPSPSSNVATIVFQGMGVKIPKETSLRVTASAPGYKTMTVLSKRIYKGVISSSESQPPS